MEVHIRPPRAALPLGRQLSVPVDTRLGPRRLELADLRQSLEVQLGFLALMEEAEAEGFSRAATGEVEVGVEVGVEVDFRVEQQGRSAGTLFKA